MKKSNKIEIEKRVLKFIERRNKQLKETEKYKALALIRGDLDYIYDKCRRGIITLLETSDNRFHNEIAEQISCLYNQRNFNLNELDELTKLYVKTKGELLKYKNSNEREKFFEKDIKDVKNNIRLYPILFNYIDEIKKKISKDPSKSSGIKYSKGVLKITMKHIFDFISDITGRMIKSTAIKKYYYDTYLQLIKK